MHILKYMIVEKTGLKSSTELAVGCGEFLSHCTFSVTTRTLFSPSDCITMFYTCTVVTSL